MSEEDKGSVSVAFPRTEFPRHRGMGGLKYYLIVMYLRKHVQTFGDVSFTLNGLLNECGYMTKTRNASFYSDVREIIRDEIIGRGFASSDGDIMAVRPSDFYTLKVSHDAPIFCSPSNFVLMSVTEYERIAQSQAKGVNRSILAGVYLFIKQFIYDGDCSLKVSYPTKKQIGNGIGISSQTTVEAAISSLESIGMLHVRRGLFVEDVKNLGEFIPARNVYAIDGNELRNKDVAAVLENNVYGRPVYGDGEVPGKIRYLNREL